MLSVEKEGMKLYSKLEAIVTAESARLQDNKEDFGTHYGTHTSTQSLNTLKLGHSLNVLKDTSHILQS